VCRVHQSAGYQVVACRSAGFCFRAGYIGLWLGLAAVCVWSARRCWSSGTAASARRRATCGPSWHPPDVTLDRLDAALGPLPHVALGTWPTPLVPLPRLGEALGIDLWVKRDECSGLALGGNKARKLEFVLGEALAAGARTIVTAGLTSNHTMMTAAAADD
jgi:hypothetical protein